jgi:hypothetical protein
MGRTGVVGNVNSFLDSGHNEVVELYGNDDEER